MKYLPLLLKVNRKKCVVIGSGRVGIRRAKELVRCGAETHLIITTKVKPKLKDRIKIHSEYSANILKGAQLLFIATSDRKIKHSALGWAKRNGVPVNTADDPEKCDFIMPSIMRRGDLTIAISTGGKVPGLSKGLREYLENTFNNEFSRLIEEMSRLRKKVRKRLNKSEERIKIIKGIPFDEIVRRIAGRDKKFSKRLIKQFLNEQNERIKRLIGGF